MWQDGKFKLFISHKSEHRQQVSTLADALCEFGIHGFVAHEDIEPTQAWMQTLDSALRSMDALLAFITDGFCSSPWTNQEIGFALAKQVPIVPLKLQNENPPAFVAHIQALSLSYDRFIEAAPRVFKTLSLFPCATQMRQGLIQAFIESTSYMDAGVRLGRLEEGITSLTDQEVNLIADGYANNNQLHGSVLVNRQGRFIDFLQQKTGRRFILEGRFVRPQMPLTVL